MPVSRLIFRLAAAALVAPFASAALAEPSFVPVYQDNFPDPHVLLHNGEFIAYATNSGLNLPMLSSKDLVHWAPVVDAQGRRVDGMPSLASWAEEGRTWAPEVLKVGNQWLLYYTARSRALKTQCVGVAIAADPRGPFRDPSGAPLVCQTDQGGTIDANPFRDADGKLYLYYKSDGNAVGKTTYIWGQRLTDDGLKITGDAVPLIKDDQKWEWKLVEAPQMVKAPSNYQLFYSAAFFGWDATERLSNYATGYANCTGPLGPCTDAPDNPLLHSFNEREAGCLSGPGHPSIFRVGTRTFMAFHAWAATSGCRKAKDERYLYVAPLFWQGDKPTLGPSMRERKQPERG
jgi:beta-xylosidase